MKARERVSGTVFRSRPLALFSWLCIGIIVIIYTVVVFHRVQSVFSGAVIFAAGIYVLWLLGGNSAVRVCNDAVIVDNLMIRHTIPWAELADIDVAYGMKFILRDGRRVDSIMYGGSVIGQLTGYRYARRAIARMDAVRSSLQAGDGAQPTSASYSRRLNFSPWPPLVILILLEGIGALSLLAK